MQYELIQLFLTGYILQMPAGGESLYDPNAIAVGSDGINPIVIMLLLAIALGAGITLFLVDRR